MNNKKLNELSYSYIYNRINPYDYFDKLRIDLKFVHIFPKYFYEMYNSNINNINMTYYKKEKRWGIYHDFLSRNNLHDRSLPKNSIFRLINFSCNEDTGYLNKEISDLSMAIISKGE